MKKSFFFFESFVNIFFFVFIGIFVNIFIVFLTLSVIHDRNIYSQFSLFSSIGVIFFLVSRKMFFYKFGSRLKHLNYASFLISRNQLFFWILWTFNFYLIFCWIFMIFLGSTHGLGISDTKGSKMFLLSDEKTTKLTGLILLLVHVFLLILFKTIVYYWSRIFAFAHKEFEKRRKNLEIVRNKANLET